VCDEWRADKTGCSKKDIEGIILMQCVCVCVCGVCVCLCACVVRVCVCVGARNSSHALQRRTKENSAVEFCETSKPEADLYRAVTGEES